MALSFQIPPARASGTSGSEEEGLASGSGFYPFMVEPSEFPEPSSLTFTTGVTEVASTPLPGASSSFGVLYAANNTNATSSASVWYAAATYSPFDAEAIVENGSCGPSCGDVPLNWTTPILVAEYASPVAALAVVVMGGTLVAVASENASTLVYAQATNDSWYPLGEGVVGTLLAATADPVAVALVTRCDGQLWVTTLSSEGAQIGQATLPVSGVVDAGITFSPDGSTYLESVVISTAASNDLEVSTSTNAESFTSPAVFGNYSTASPNATFSSIGDTPLNSSGGVPGQLDLTSIGGQLFLLYSTNVSGQTIPETESSQNGGANWQGPYVTGPVNGSVLDPTVAVAPTGQVFAAWDDPDYGAGAVEQAVYFPDGMPEEAPQTVNASSGPGVSPTGAASVAVDDFDRPFVVWPYASNDSGAVAYTGGFFGPSFDLGLVAGASTNLVSNSDLSSPSTGTRLASFQGNVSSDVGWAEANLTGGNLCTAQNLTATELYANVSHVPLTVGSLAGTACAGSLDPDTSSSPLLTSEGTYAPSTVLAVYVDWALEAEGVPVSVSCSRTSASSVRSRSSHRQPRSRPRRRPPRASAPGRRASVSRRPHTARPPTSSR